MKIPSSCVQCGGNFHRDTVQPIWYCNDCGMAYDERKEMSPNIANLLKQKFAADDRVAALRAEEDALPVERSQPQVQQVQHDHKKVVEKTRRN